MMKLIIADDEKWVRTAIKTLIPIEKLGLTMSCEAANGIEALELCRQHEPDILLTDIKMPGLTGLELIKEVRKLLPELRIVVISGYNDFEYAKTAMKYGIADYLLKPVDENELVQVLERIVAELCEQTRLMKAKEAVEEQYRKAQPIMCEAFLNQVISRNSMTADKMRSELHKYGIELFHNSYTLCVTTPDESLKPEENRYRNDYYRLIVKRTMKRYLNACEALETRFWEGSSTLAVYKAGCLGKELRLILSEEMLNKITLNLKLSNIQTALSYIDSISNSLKNGSYINPTLVKEFFWQFVQSIIILLNIQLPLIRHEAMVTGEQPYERVKGTLFMISLESYMKELLQRIFNFYHDKNPLDSNNLVENAKKVIESNFAGDISLEQVAKHVHLSPAYLSELFKKEIGMSFIDYKTIIKIEYAKKLLCVPSMNISEISGKVGYSDPKYFSKLFKKITGKTIYEYRKEVPYFQNT